MIELGAHSEFIFGAYVGVTLVTLGLIAWVILDSRAQKKRLADLEARGIGRRRSAADGGA